MSEGQKSENKSGAKFSLYNIQYHIITSIFTQVYIIADSILTYIMKKNSGIFMYISQLLQIIHIANLFNIHSIINL